MNNFIAYIAPTAQKVCRKNNLPCSVCIAQAILESGWGKHCIGNYNYWGRKYGGWGKSATKVTKEHIKGKWVTITAKFQSYDSLEQAVNDWCRLIKETPRYRSVIKTWHAPWILSDFVKALAKVYATDPKYADKVMSVIKKNNLMKFD